MKEKSFNLPVLGAGVFNSLGYYMKTNDNINIIVNEIIIETY